MAVKPDLSTTKGTCGNPLPAKSESSGKPVWPLKRQLQDTTQSGQGLHALPSHFTGALPNLCSYAHVFFTVIKINLGIVAELHLIQIDKNSTVPVLGYLQKIGRAHV